jgi:chemotaxis protein methyltransferase WspC
VIEDLLQSRIGLNVDSVGMKKIDADILVRMKERGISSRKDYEALLDTSKEEFNELVNIITVPETWFFRSMSSFEFLEKYIRLEWLRKNTGKIRILSIPCSTGEEAYSIAITLLDCGFAPDDFSVEGADINTVKTLKKDISVKKTVFGN